MDYVGIGALALVSGPLIYFAASTAAVMLLPAPKNPRSDSRSAGAAGGLLVLAGGAVSFVQSLIMLYLAIAAHGTNDRVVASTLGSHAVNCAIAFVIDGAITSAMIVFIR